MDDADYGRRRRQFVYRAPFGRSDGDSGTAEKIVSGKYSGFAVRIGEEGKTTGYVAEGPYLYEEDGKIVLLWSTFTESGYSVIRNISENGVYGDYAFDKKLFEKDGGHCMRFTDLQGKSHIVLHQPNTSPLERAVLIDD